MRPARRRVVDRLRATWRVSIRRACSVLQAEQSSYHYKGKRRPQAVLNKRIKEIAETRGATAIGESTCCCAVKAGA
jgi:putative transposase